MRGIVAFATLIAALVLTAAPAVAVESSAPAAAAGSTESTTTTASTQTGYSQTPELKEGAPELKEGAGYKQKPQAPKPRHRGRPSPERVEKVERVVEREPEQVVKEVTVTTPSHELPFTGYDLRWVIGVGLLLIASGAASLLVIRRRERRVHH
ncbi:MAG: hypothetical protein ACYCYN_02460 [Solirubrobacteraceae bacterium]